MVSKSNLGYVMPCHKQETNKQTSKQKPWLFCSEINTANDKTMLEFFKTSHAVSCGSVLCNNMLQHSFGHKLHLRNLGCHLLVYYFQNLEFVCRSSLTLLTICLLGAGEQIQGAMNPLRRLYHWAITPPHTAPQWGILGKHSATGPWP